MASLPFGKKAQVGNFVVLKYTKALSKTEVKKLRAADGILADVQKQLQRGSLAYIKVSTISGSWSVEYVCGTTMFDTINAFPVAYDENENLVYYGDGYSNLYSLLNGIFTDSATVGDAEYGFAKQIAMQMYLDRACKIQAANLTKNEKYQDERKALMDKFVAAEKNEEHKLAPTESRMLVYKYLEEVDTLTDKYFNEHESNRPKEDVEESEKAANEELKREEHKAVLLKMAKEAKDEGRD